MQSTENDLQVEKKNTNENISNSLFYYEYANYIRFYIVKMAKSRYIYFFNDVSVLS